MNHPKDHTFSEQRSFVAVSLSYISQATDKPKAAAHMCNVMVLCHGLLEIEDFRSLFFKEFRKYTKEESFINNLEEHTILFAERNYLLERKDTLWESTYNSLSSSISVGTTNTYEMASGIFGAIWNGVYNRIYPTK